MPAIPRLRTVIVPALLFGQNVSSVAWGAAAEPQRIGLIEPELDGSFDRGAAEELARRVRSGVERSRLEVVDATPAKRCADAACFAELAEGTQTTHLVRAVVNKADRDYHLRLELRDLNGETVSTVEETCEICGVEEAADMLEAAATRLTAPLAGGAEVASLRVKSRPAGASIYVDGEPMGTAPKTLDLPAGKHTIELRKDGFASASRTVDLEAGVKTSSEMQLVPTAATPSRRAKILGGTFLGGGLALVAGGIALVAVDGREYENRCDGPDVDVDGDCRFVYRLKWPGAALIATGAALAGVGITILVVDRRRTRAATRAKVKVTPTGISLTGRF